jgi:hypothetical protein
MHTFTILGDPHAKPDNLEKINQLIDIAEFKGNPTIILGDLLDTKEIVRGSCLNTYYRRFKASKLRYYILVGNHDMFHEGAKEHSLEPLKGLPNVTIIDAPYKMGNMLLLPYYANHEEFKKVVRNTLDCSVLIMHQGINGSDYGNGYIAENEIDFEELAHFKRVIGGHFHRYQERGNLLYLGTPFSHSFGESNQTKYIAEYKPIEDEITIIPTSFPQHMTYTVDCTTTSLLPFQVNEKNYNRVILEGDAVSIEKFEIDHYPGVRFLKKPKMEVVEHTLEESEAPETIFTKWARDIKKLDQQTINIGLQILKDIK